MEQRERSTHQRILDAAEKLFAEKGYKETTTREIVREAGASLSSLQAHFQGKENVYVEVRQRAVKEVQRIMQPSMDEVKYLDQEGLLYGEMAWNLLSEIVSKYAEWCFESKNKNTIILVGREILEGAPVPCLPEEIVAKKFSVIQLLCERYTNTRETDWSTMVGRILLTTMLALSGECYRQAEKQREQLQPAQSPEEIKYQMKSYLLLTLHAYLDIRKTRAQEGGPGTGRQTQPDQAG